MTPRAGRAYLRAVRLALLLPAAFVAGCATAAREPAFQQIEATAVHAGHAKVLGLLTSGPGRLVVYGSETDSLSVRYALSTTTRAGLVRNQVETIDKPDSLFVTIRPAEGSTIDLQVEMPERLAVVLRDEGRDVIIRNVENRVEVMLHTGGSLDVDDVEGPLRIHDERGPIRIHDVRGPVDVVDAGGRIVIDDVKNSVRVQTGTGAVTISDVEADVDVITGPGDLVVRDVKGALAYTKRGGGRVTIERVAGGVTRR